MLGGEYTEHLQTSIECQLFYMHANSLHLSEAEVRYMPLSRRLKYLQLCDANQRAMEENLKNK